MRATVIRRIRSAAPAIVERDVKPEIEAPVEPAPRQKPRNLRGEIVADMHACGVRLVWWTP